MHARQQIRDAIATTLDGLTTTGSNVFKSRVYNTRDQVLPCLLIYTLTDEIGEVQSIGYPRIVDRDMTLAVEARVKATSGFDATVDTICEEVEAALATDLTLGGLTRDILHASTQIAYTADGDKPYGSALMSFNIRYRVKEDAPGTPIA